VNPEQVYGRTRQSLWNGVIESISHRAELAKRAIGDSIVVSLRSAGSEDIPKWDAYYSMHLGDEDWSRLEAHQRWSSSLIDRITGLERGGEDIQVDLVDEIRNAPPLPFHEDSPMWNNVPLVSTAGEDDHLNFWPRDWHLPQLWLGSLDVGPVDILTDGISVGRVQEATSSKLVELASSTKSFINVVDEDTEFDASFKGNVQMLEARANEFFSLMGYPHYRLSLDLKTPVAWFVGKTPEWKVASSHPTAGLRPFDLDSLSAAEQRWAVAAIQWALVAASHGRTPRVLLIDEPERGLHRLREKDLPSALSKLCSKDQNLTVFTASHAPSFVDLRNNSQILRVTRTQGFHTSLVAIDSAMDGPLAGVSEQLGLTAGDVLQLTRVFVLVEGLHDEIVLGHLLADDLAKSSAQLLPLRGAKDLRSVAEAKVLFSSTEAMFLIVLDGLPMEEVRPIWDEVREHAAGARTKAARSALGRLKLVKGGGELKWLEELGHAALDTARLPRIEVHGLGARDIILYLPESSFMDTSKTWTELEAEYEAQCALRSREGRQSFKEWLKTHYNAHFTKADFENAVKAASPNQEFQRIGLTIQTLARFGRPDPLSSE
jgi:hypothetical protein